MWFASDILLGTLLLSDNVIEVVLISFVTIIIITLCTSLE